MWVARRRPKRLFGSSTKPKREHNVQNSLQNFSRKSANYWSGRRESNPRMQLGKLPLSHGPTPAHRDHPEWLTHAASALCRRSRLEVLREFQALRLVVRADSLPV